MIHNALTRLGGSLNTALPITEEVYNVVPYAKVFGATADPNLVSLLVGTTSMLCRTALLNPGPLPLTCRAGRSAHAAQTRIWLFTTPIPSLNVR